MSVDIDVDFDIAPPEATPIELAKAAQGYLSVAGILSDLPAEDVAVLHPTDLTEMRPPFWPWHPEWWHPRVDPTENFAIAAALCATAIAHLNGPT